MKRFLALGFLLALIGLIVPAMAADDDKSDKAAAKEAGDQQRKLMAESDVTLLAEFKANPDVVVNEPDRAPFQAATAGVIEKYKGESYGDFVTEVLAAAGVAG